MFQSHPTTVTPLAGGQFQVEIDSSQVRGLGGPGSAGLAEYVNQEVTNSGLCKSGARVLSEWWGSDYYGIKGQCR